jgi:hypothetical protein
METKDKAEELKEKFGRFYTEILETYKGNPAYDEIRELISNFENVRAPEAGLFPNHPKYWIIKSIIPACYIRTSEDKTVAERHNLRVGVLTTYGFDEDEISSIMARVNRQTLEKWLE